jgi:adenylate cyclase
MNSSDRSGAHDQGLAGSLKVALPSTEQLIQKGDAESEPALSLLVSICALPTKENLDNVDTAFSLHDASTTVMFVDVVESVRHTLRDERAAVTRIQSLLGRAARNLVPQFEGRLVERVGDGLMVEFDNAPHAVRCAVALHALAAEDGVRLDIADRLHLRVGIHATEVLTDDVSLFGHGVNLTARIAALAAPGETVVSAAVRDQLTPGLDPDVEDMGECFVKHVLEPVRAYRVSSTLFADHAGALPNGSDAATQIKPTIAVIPFSCVPKNAADTAMGQVIADDLIATISRCEYLRVISRLSTQAFSHSAAALPEIGRLLACDYVATGSYRIVQGEMEMSIELAQVRSGMVIWAERYRTALHQGWLGETDLIDTIAAAVLEHIVESEVGVVRHCALPNVTDYSLLLGAVALMYRTQYTDFLRARQALEHLAERHPRSATPLAWMAKWHVFKVTQGWFDDLEKEASHALALASRALAISPTHDAALTVAGLVATNLRKRPDEGAALCDKALDANPNNSLASLYRGLAFAFQGKGDQALYSARLAMRLSPLDPHRFYYQSLAATAALAAEQWALALELGTASLRANRLHTSTLRVIAIAATQMGDGERARQAVVDVLRIDPSLTVTGYLARSPARDYAVGRVWAESLGRAGIPA